MEKFQEYINTAKYVGYSWLYEVNNKLQLETQDNRSVSHDIFVKNGNNVSLKNKYWVNYYEDNSIGRDVRLYKSDNKGISFDLNSSK